MTTHQRFHLSIVSAVLVATMSAVAFGQATQPVAPAEPVSGKLAQPQPGRVTGNDVYVRSGFHQNYYPVTKLNRGDEITIIGFEHGWLEILPPAGTHSLIEKVYVDRDPANPEVGALNDTAWVHAGSNLNDRRYAKQVQLDRGAKVKVLGETTDGAWLKIEPPAGASLWISGEFVSRDGSIPAASDRNLEPVRPGELGTTTRPATGAGGTGAGIVWRGEPPRLGTPATSTGPAAIVESTSTPPPPKTSNENYNLEIQAIDAMVRAEGVKPAEQRSYEPIIGRLVPLAEQKDDEITRLYAETMIRQLRNQAEAVSALRELREIRESAISEADREANVRGKIQANAAVPADMIVARGLIKVSGLYDGVAGRPKRWRIVEPDSNRTTAFIEVPSGSPIDPVVFYGKYVGIRALSQRVSSGTVPPVPVFVVSEIVVVDPESVSDTPPPGTAFRASPRPADAETQPSDDTAETEPAPAPQ